MTMFSCTHVRVGSVGVTGFDMWGGMKLMLTGFTALAAGASAITYGTSLSARGALALGEGGFCLGSEESAGTRVRFDLEAMENDI
jgi:hypothetical protein